MRKRKLHTLALTFLLLFPAFSTAQTLTLDSCRALALKNNKELQIAQQGITKSHNEQRAAHTTYLPKISLTAGYMRTGNEIQLLTNSQQAALNSLGTNLAPAITDVATAIVQKYPELAPLVQSLGNKIVPALDGAGHEIADAFRTDTRNLYTGALILTQPLYMGGKIKAYNKITQAAEEVAGLQYTAQQQDVLLSVDQAYWQVVSLANKQRLAQAYLKMLQTFDSDVQKMVAQGVATKSDELSIAVKVNEAEMTLTKVNDGLRLARMLLCQRCGLPISDALLTADEGRTDFTPTPSNLTPDVARALENRTEIKQLEKAIDIYDQKVRLQRSDYLPHLALTGGYMVSNPNVFNGFQNNFRGTWGVGVTLSVPVLTWNEHKYKINAAKAEAQMARLRLDDAREKIELQVNQATLNAQEAHKNLKLALKNEEKAQENLRMAQIAFKEESETTSNILAAHTAWLQAESQKIDAQIDIKLAETNLQDVLGIIGK